MESLKIKVFYIKKDVEENNFIEIECSQVLEEAIDEARYSYLDGKSQIFYGEEIVYEVSDYGEVVYNEALLEYKKVS